MLIHHVGDFTWLHLLSTFSHSSILTSILIYAITHDLYLNTVLKSNPVLLWLSHFDVSRCVRQCLRGCSNRRRISRRAAAESRAFIVTGLVRSKERTLCRGKCQTHGGHVWWQSRGTWGQVSLADPRKHDFLKNWKRLFVEKSAEWIVCWEDLDWLHCYRCVHTSFSAKVWTRTEL